MGGAKVHIIRSPERGGRTVVTFCGINGYRTSVPGEFDTVASQRFDAVPAASGATCKTCLRLRASLPRKEGE